MKFLFTGIAAITLLSAFVFFGNTKPLLKVKSTITKPFVKKKIVDKEIAIIKNYGNKIKPFVKANNYCEEYCFLIDMKIPSGKKRFFVYDLIQDTILNSGLVTHGGGSQTTTDALTFNNTPNANATSLGKYKIGIEYNGRFGMAFKLHGLEASNNKAFERFVVLHGHSCVPTQEIDPFPICTSLGCPTVSPSFLPTLKKYIDKADKPVVLWIFY
jgi:L,D-transpeptidase catalytic domain